MWVKRGILSGTYQYLFSFGNTGNTDAYGLAFNASTDTLYFYSGVSYPTVAVYRDPTAWYHIVLSNNAGAFTLYVNGVSAATGTAATIPSGSVMNIGRYAYGSGSLYFDGDINEVNFVSGQTLAATAFGATGANSQWLPIPYTGTYGASGFHLTFGDATSTTTLMADSSGNGNNWTPNNVFLTPGIAYDSLTDVPTISSKFAANYAVLNPLQDGAGTLSAANLNMTGLGTAAWATRVSTIAVTSGSWYFEVTPTSGSVSSGIMFGITKNPYPSGSIALDSNGYGYYGNNGQKYNNNAGVAYGAIVADNDIVGVAFDATNGSVTFYKNNVSQGVAFSGLSAGTWYFGVSCYGTATASINFGQRPFSYTPPTGYVALNTYNLAAGTVTTSGTFTGNGNGNGPMVWLNGTPTTMTINGNAVIFGTQADKLASGFKLRTGAAAYNAVGSNSYTVSVSGAVFKYEDAQGNP
jgi:hypothetical protein